MRIEKIIYIDKDISNFIFQLRNKSYVRKNSLFTSLITFKSHNIWIKEFFRKKNKLFIIFKRKLPIGYVRLQKEKKIYNTSWALMKKYQGKGYAKKFLKLTTKNKSLKYKALIKEKNIASIKIALAANFKIKRKKNHIFYLFKN